MKWKLACADFTFPLLRHDQSLDLIAMLGFEGVDIGLFRRPVAPLAFARLCRPEGVGPRAGSASCATAGWRSPIFFSRPLPISSRSPPTIPISSSVARRATGSRGPSSSLSSCGGRHISALPGVTFDGRARSRVVPSAAATSWPGAARPPARKASRFPSRHMSARSFPRPSRPPGWCSRCRG